MWSVTWDVLVTLAAPPLMKPGPNAGLIGIAKRIGDVAEIDVEILRLRRPAAAKPGLDARADGPTELAGREIARARQERAGLQRGGEDHGIGRTGESIAILDRAPSQTAGHVPQGIVETERRRVRALSRSR